MTSTQKLAAPLSGRGYCACAPGVPILSLLNGLRPHDEAPGLWFGRSGAVMTAFAAFAQFKAAGIEMMLRGTTFAESWEAYRIHICHQQVLSWASLVLIVLGTLVWGYGDLIYAAVAHALR